MAHPLDGKGPLERQSDGETEIRDGKTSRYDEANCYWTSTFEIISDKQVKMVSVADASNTVVDFLLTAQNGTPTRGPCTYESVLKLSRKGDKIQMSGQINYGNHTVILTLRKIGP
jgi:hypothetical protein